MDKPTAWSFKPERDVPQHVGQCPITWIEVDEPRTGSMQIVHDSAISREEAIARTRLAAAAPKLVAALEQEAEQVYAILCSDGGGDIPARIVAAQEHVSKWRAIIREARKP